MLPVRKRIENQQIKVVAERSGASTAVPTK